MGSVCCHTKESDYFEICLPITKENVKIITQYPESKIEDIA
jgi:hypothetical protein